MPAPIMLTCLRCHKEYDDQDEYRTACEVQQESTKQWGDETLNWEECHRCGKSHTLHGRRKKGLSDAGPLCFKGRHSADPEVVGRERWAPAERWAGRRGRGRAVVVASI